MRALPRRGAATLALLIAATLALPFLQTSPSAGASPAYRARAALTQVIPGKSRSTRWAIPVGALHSPHRACLNDRSARFYHRVGHRDVYLSRGLKGPAGPHLTDSKGKVDGLFRVPHPNRGAYYMTVAPRKLPGGALCLAAKSRLRRASRGK